MKITKPLPCFAILLAGLLLAGCGGKGLSVHHEAIIIRAEAERDSTPIREMAGGGSVERRVRAIRAIGRIARPGDVDLLLSALEDEDAKIRSAAIFALGEMQDADTLAMWGGKTDERVAPVLIELLDSGDPGERGLAAEALGKVRDEAAADRLRQLVEEWRRPIETDAQPVTADTSSELTSAMIALMRLKHEASIGVIAEKAGDKHPDVRETALTAIGRIGGPAARAVCLEHLKDVDAAMRALALKGLAKSGTPEDVASIAAALADAKAPLSVKVEAVRALRAIKSADAVKEIDAQLAEYGDSAVEDGAGWAFEYGETSNLLIELIGAAGESSTNEYSAILLSRLRGWENGVGFHANEAYANVLVRRGEPDKYFEFPDDFKVRTVPALNHHIRAMGALKTERAETELNNLVKGPGASEEVKERLRKVQSATVEALYTVMKERDPAAAEKFLEPALLSLEPYSRVTAMTLAVAGEDGETTPSETLLPFFPHALYTYSAFDPSVNLAAVEALAKYDPANPKVSKALNHALKNRSRHVRMAAMKVLGRSTPRDFDEIIYDPQMSAGWSPLNVYAGQKETVEEFYERVAARARRRVIMKVTLEHHGAIAIELDPVNAPLTVESFEFLDSLNFFTGTGFQRIVPNFVIQGGDPRQNNEGGPDYLLPCEVNRTPFQRGTVGMAHAGKDTGGCQFFICLSPQPHLDGGYTAWGQVLASVQDDPEVSKALGEIKNGYDVIDSVIPYEPIKEIEFFEF